MGAYLSQPVTAKDSSDGASDAYAYGTTAMQGWRTNMEVRRRTRGARGFFLKNVCDSDAGRTGTRLERDLGFGPVSTAPVGVPKGADGDDDDDGGAKTVGKYVRMMTDA